MYSDDILYEVTEYGKYNYNIDQMLILLHGRVTEKTFRADFQKKSSLIYIAYHQGRMNAALDIDKALHKAAGSGNVQAIEMIRMRNLLNEEGD
jgi:hypothetical protein